MRNAQSIICLGALLASLGAAPVAWGQTYDDGTGYGAQAPAGQGYWQGQQDYQQRQQQYRDDYSTYQDQRSAYDAQRQAYEQRRANYDRERADYDAQYGAGAFERYYRDRPDAYDARYGVGAFDHDFAGRRPAYRYGAPSQPYDDGDDGR